MKKYFLIVITLLFSLTAANAQTFTFKMTKFGAVTTDGKAIPITPKQSTVSVRTDRMATGVIVEIDGETMFTSTARWKLGSDGDLVVSNNAGTNKMIISLAKHNFNFEDKNAVLIFSDPASTSSFQNNFNQLKNILVSSGRLDGAKSSSGTPSTSKNQYAGVKVPIAKLLSKPFGYTPVYGKPYGQEALIKSAKNVYGWTIGETKKYNSKSVGLVWENLDGMTLFGYPVWHLISTPYEDKYSIGGTECYVVAPKDKESYLRNEFESLLKANGYKKFTNICDTTYWSNGTTLVYYSTYTYESRFPGKVILSIEAFVVANQKVVNEFKHPDGCG